MDGERGFRYFNGGWKPVGTYSGFIQYFDFGPCGFDWCKRNAALRIDDAYSQFIINTAFDF